MKIIYFIHRISASGGVKVLFQHLNLLKARGIEAEIVTLKEGSANIYGDKVRVIKNIDYSYFNADVCVATKPNDILALYSAGIHKKMPICHFVQGDELAELEARIKKLLYLGLPPLSALLHFPRALKYFRRKKRFVKAYSLPSVKMAVSKHICKSIQDRFQQNCFEISNGIDHIVFNPGVVKECMEFGKQWRIVSIGSYKVKTKGIEFILGSIRLLKEAGFSVHLTRIAGVPISSAEKDSGLVDSYYQAIPEGKVADLIRASDVMVLGAMEEEGFGLPAIEAMACKTPCILTLIPAFIDFDEKRDFACFVPPRDSQAIADGVQKIMLNKGYRECLERRGFQVAQNYSLEIIGDRLEKFFSNLLRKD